MQKVYIAVAGLSIVVIAAIAYGFSEVGSPGKRYAIQNDQTRVSNLTSISYSIQTYYSKNQKLPDKLSDVANSYTKTTDPKTEQPYGYSKVSDTSYKLCATFETDSADNKESNSYDMYGFDGATKTHKKGYDCITYDIPKSYINSNSILDTLNSSINIDDLFNEINNASSAKVTAALANSSSVPDVFLTPNKDSVFKQGISNTILYDYAAGNGILYLVDEKNTVKGNLGEPIDCSAQFKQCTLAWKAQSLYITGSVTPITVTPGKYYLVLADTFDQGKLAGKSKIFTIAK